MKLPSDSGILEKIEADLQKLDDPLRVAVVGCFNAGKSTLINALVGAKVCKTGIRPVTMKLSHIPYQNGERIELVDTMGVDAMDFPEHKEETADAIANADAVIYAVNARNLGTNGDRFIRDTLRACKTPWILVVTHWDQVEEIEDQAFIRIIRQAAQKLANDFFPQQDQTSIFYVDAKMAERQNALKQAVVPSNNGDFAKLEMCIQTKLGDKDNKQRIKTSNVLHNLLSELQKRVDHLKQKCKELGQKNWASEYEQIEKQFKEESVAKEIHSQNQRLDSAQEYLNDLKKRRGSASAMEDLNERLIKAKKDAAEAGVASGILTGMLVGAGAGSMRAPGPGTVIGAAAGGLAGLIQGDQEKKRLKGIVRTILGQKQEAEKTWNYWNPLVEDQEKVVKHHDQELQKLKKQEEQLEVNRDEAKAKVAQQEEAEEVRERCLMLIRRFEQHLHTIREHLKDHKCLWGQFSQSSRRNMKKPHNSIEFLIGCVNMRVNHCRNNAQMHSRNWKINLYQWGLVMIQEGLWLYFPAQAMHCRCWQMRKILVKCHVLNALALRQWGNRRASNCKKRDSCIYVCLRFAFDDVCICMWGHINLVTPNSKCTPFWNCLDLPRCWRIRTFSTSAALVKRQEFALWVCIGGKWQRV